MHSNATLMDICWSLNRGWLLRHSENPLSARQQITGVVHLAHSL
jgi:hypothetical protein